jgi:hypothetical protein
VAGVLASGAFAACVGMPVGRWAAAPASGGLSASARAEPGFRRLRGCLPVEVGGEERFAVGWAPDASGPELGTHVSHGVVGESVACILADSLAGAGSLDGALGYFGAGCGLFDGQLSEHADGELPERVLLGVAVLGECVIEVAYKPGLSLSSILLDSLPM